MLKENRMLKKVFYEQYIDNLKNQHGRLMWYYDVISEDFLSMA